MRQFSRNVLRLSLAGRGSFFGAVFIIALGVFCYVSMTDTLRNLSGQVNAYYESAALADGFAAVAGIPEADLERLAELPGIGTVSGRMAADLRLLADGQEELVTVHLLSYDEADALNCLALSGEFTDETNGLFLGVRMADICGYEPGEPLRILSGGTTRSFSFAGTVSAPDYIYSIPPGGAMIPDGEIYDIACIRKEEMRELLGGQALLQELAFTLEPGYTWDDVKGELSETLDPYGVSLLCAREDQTSYRMVAEEMDQLTSMGILLPLMFLSISVFMLYVVRKKRIENDRSLLGTMKAFGLTDGEMLAAYLLEGAVIGAAGAVLGGVTAGALGRYMFAMYVDFFNLPDTVYHDFLSTRLAGLVLACATGLAASFFGVCEILRIAPAQAMRAGTPSVIRGKRLPEVILRILGPMERFGVRSILRNPFRAFLIALAVGFPFSMTSVLFSYGPAADTLFLDRYEKIQVYDLQLSLDAPVSPLRAAEAGLALEGVSESEPAFIGTISLSHENHSEFAVLYALKPDSDFWHITDIYGAHFAIPEHGIILNTRYAEKLHIRAGDTLTVRVPGLTAGSVQIPAAAVISESTGSGCYLSLEAFPDLFGVSPAANTVLLRTKPGQLSGVKQALLETSRVAWLADTDKIVASYRSMLESMNFMVDMFAVLSVAAGGVLIYQISMINLRERMTELGTLLVLGKTERELGRMLLFEQAVYFLLGILLGIPGSRGIKYLIETVMISDNYTMDIRMDPASFAAAFLICLAIAAAAFFAEFRFVSQISLTEILKERE